jgi:16S rRNA processing protein RimM
MSIKPSYLAVGHVKDAHGVRGDVYVRLFAGEAEWSKKLKEARFRSRQTGEVKTFAVVKQRPHKEGLVITLEGVVDRNFAETLKGFTFEVEESRLVAKAGETPYLHEVSGFLVVDASLGEIGPVKSFSFNGAQDILVVDYSDREVWIPFVQAFVRQIDYENKRIEMDLPAGLLEV